MPARPYQAKAIVDIATFYKSGGLHCILEAPTGTGKTYIFSLISKKVDEKGNKVLILTDRGELLFQASGAIKNVGLQAMHLQAGIKVVSNAFNVYIGMSQTLRNRYKQPYWITFFKSIDLFIIDECHEQQFNWIFESGLLDKKHVIGFTATPKRTGKMRQLALDYETIIETISIREAINLGYLVNDDYIGISPPDLSDVELDPKTGDYKTSSLFKKYNSPITYAGAVKNYKENSPNTKALCFCVNKEHCVKTAVEFNEAGINAKFIISNTSHPKMPENIEDLGKMARYIERKRVYDFIQANKHLTGIRKELFEDFKNDKFSILINSGIATKGYDEPSIMTVITLRATLSSTLWKQIQGRGGRICPEINKTHFNNHDFGDNAFRLGHYSEDRIWSLWHETFEGEGLPPIKTCGFNADGLPIIIDGKGGCGRPILASYKICPFCGFKYPVKEVKEIDLQSIMFDTETKTAIKTKRIKDMTNKELHAYREAKGHKQAWLWRQLWYREKKLEDKRKSIESFGKEFEWSTATVKKAIIFGEGL